MTKRIGYFDIARGIGILLVVMGHNDFGYVSPFGYQIIYSFHMPLFFFLSGYFIDLSIGFWGFAKKRFHALLKPYFFMIFLIYFFSVSFEKMGFQTALGRIIKSLYASGYYLDWVQLWFLPHLFVVSIYAFFFSKTFVKVNNRYIKWMVLIATLFIASVFLKSFYPFPLTLSGKTYNLFGLPFSLDLILLSGFFFILGGEIRERFPDKMYGNLFLFLGSGAVVLISNYFFTQQIDFNMRIYESVLINTAQAIAGIFFIITLSRQIELHSKLLTSWLSYIGRISMIILIFHVPIQDLWGRKIMTATGNQSLSIWAGFVMGVAGSVLIYELFIKTNPVASWWFGRQAEIPEQKAAQKNE